MNILKIKEWVKHRDDKSNIIYLIENIHFGYVEYGTFPILKWTKDFDKALKFENKYRALKCVKLYSPYTSLELIVTEHMYM